MRRFIILSAVAILLQLAVHQSSEAQNFSVEAGSTDTAAGFPPPDDILTSGPAPVLIGGTGLEVNAFTFGRLGAPPAMPIFDFSVDASSAGAAGSAVFIESTTGPGEQNYDVYRSGLMGTNILKHDGNGVGAAGLAPPLGMAEPQVVLPFGTGVDGYDGRPSAPIPGADIYWTWDSASVPIGPSASGADILISTTGGGAYVPLGGVYALEGALGLGTLGPGDNIDALDVWDNAPAGVFDPGDVVLFSLDPVSPSLAVFGATPADILLATTAGTGVVIPAGALGLAPGDNLTTLAVHIPGDLPVTLQSFSVD